MKLFAYFALMLVLPTAVIISRNGTVIEVLPMLLSTAGLAALLFSLVSLLKKVNLSLAALTGILLLLSALLTRFILGFLYDFSGRGFSSDVFSQLSLSALKIAALEYDNQLMVMTLLFTIISYFVVRLLKRQPEIHSGILLALLPLSALLIQLGAAASPEMLMAQAYQHYSLGSSADQSLTRAAIREQSTQLLAPLRPSTPLPIERPDLRASLPKKPLNLLLIYLESFNETFSNSEQYPGLTPRIDAFKKRFYSFDHIHSSSYVTIEGIANSQCGTLMNMEYANSSLVTRKGRLTDLPCLGDILGKAGYQQIYMGGAELVFAGKGAFLRDHGYGDVKGWRYWDDQGYKRFGDWGLSDTTLFNTALDTILEKRKQQQPFNLTMLTLGTHVPGFVYPECPAYPADKDTVFLNAIYCTDYLLGEFIDKLDANGVLEDTVVMMQGDHGVFIRPDILKLFGDKAADTRLLTMLSIPKSAQPAAEQLGLTREGSNVDTAASLLDLLNIDYNTEFMFGQSHFDPNFKPLYYVTRRQDYQNGVRYDNDRYRCREEARDGPLVLPLDHCDKNRVMQAISSLNLTYAAEEDSQNRICELAVDTRIDEKSGQVQVKWGNQNLSGQFYRRGSKRNKHHIDGIYGVLLSENNVVRQALFFEPDREEDMRDIAEIFKAATAGDRMLFMRHANMPDIQPNVARLWPNFLREASIVYGEFDGKQFVPEFSSDDPELVSHFTPASCATK